jgi:type IV secretory pathway TrbL component
MLTFGTFADPKAPTYGEAFGVALGALFLGGLAWFIPAKVAGVISGGPALSAGAAVGTMAAMAATAAVGGMGVAAAAKAASGTNALRAASTGGGASRGGLGLPSSGAPGGAGVSPAGGGAGRGGLSPQMKANPALSSHALETIDRTERAHAAAKSGGVKPPAAAEHERAQEYRGLAWDIGTAMQESNPEVAEKVDSELGRIEAIKFKLAEDGVSSRLNSAHLAEEYRNVTTRALNLDGGGGFETPTLSTSLTPEGQAQNASLASSLGVGDDIRAMAVKGMTTRQIAAGLGDRLSAVNKQAERIGQGSDANLHRMSVVQAYKDEHGIPNPSAAGFKAWAAAEKKAQTAAASAGTQSSQPARSQPPSWARDSLSLSKIPANLNAMVPRGTEKSAGMNASNTGAQE